MQNITKRFPGVLALDDVTLELRKGEVLALLGENGAGKSTLIKILSGAYYPDSGSIEIDGKKVKYKSPTDALEAGVSVIYQELNYLDSLSIAENIFVGRLPKKLFGQIDWKKLRADSERLLELVGLNYDPFTKVSSLSVGEKQMIEIARAVSRNIKIAVMDEPTSALTDTEIEKLFNLIKNLKTKGISVIYISHRLDEVFEISDRVQVMRDGRSVGILNTAETSRDRLVELMVGRQISSMYPKAEIEIGEPILKVDNLTTSKVRNISFEVRKGEILGLFGLMGSGRTNIVEAIFGLEEIKSGTVVLNGVKTSFRQPAHAIKAGLAYVPNERKKAGVILGLSLKRNITVTCMKKFDKVYRMDTRKEDQVVKQWVQNLGIKTPHINTLIDNLSGGNQQKAVIAKWMATNPSVLLLNEPTRGIDVGAKTEIYRLMEDLCNKGLGIVMISSELPEILSIADRIVVISEGQVKGVFNRKEATQVSLMNAAVGGN